MFSVGFSVYVSCKPCKSFFQNIDKFVEHKKQFHFDQLQNTKLIILEERSESGNEPGPGSNTPNNWISPIAGPSAQKQTQIHLIVNPTTPKELNSDDIIINQQNPSAVPNNGFFVGETNPLNNNKHDQYASGLNCGAAPLNSFSANCVHELFPCSSTTTRSNLNSEALAGSMAQTNHLESAFSGNGHHRHPHDLDFNLLNNYQSEIKNSSNHNNDLSCIDIDIGQSNFPPVATTNLYIPESVPALLSNINFPTPGPDPDENDPDSISYNSLELNFDSNSQELHHHDNDDDFIQVSNSNFSHHVNFDSNTQDLNDEEDDDLNLEVNMNSVFIENEKSDELHPDFLGAQTDDAVSPISFDIPSEDNFNSSAIIADLDIVAVMDPDFLVDVFSETDTQHIEDFVETPKFDDNIESVPSSDSVSDCPSPNIETVSTPHIHIETESTISSKSEKTNLKASNSKSKPRYKRKFGKVKKRKVNKKSKISLLTKTTASADSVSLKPVLLPKFQDPRVRLIRLTPQEILKYCAPPNSSSIEGQTIPEKKRRGRPPNSKNKNKNSKKIKSKSGSRVGVNIRIRKEISQRIKTENEVVDHCQDANDIKAKKPVRSDGPILQETTDTPPKSRNLKITFDCKLCFHKLNSTPELEAHLKLCVISNKARGKSFCIPCNKHCHNAGGLKTHERKCHSTLLQKQLQITLSNQKPAPKPFVFTSKISGAAEKKYKGPIIKGTDLESLSSNKLLFPCQVCLQHCTSQSSLERHLRTHTRTKVDEGNDQKPQPLKCQLCPFSTHKKNALAKHIRLHPAKGQTSARYVLNPRKRNYYYKCSQLNCDKKFQFTFRLEEHYAMDHGIGKGSTVVSCPHKDCLRFFTRQHHLQQHLKSHRSRSSNKQKIKRNKNLLTRTSLTSVSKGKFNKNNKGKSSKNERKNKNHLKNK